MAKSKKKKRSHAAAKKSAVATALLLNQAIKPISDEYEMLFLKNSTKPLLSQSSDNLTSSLRESDEFDTIEYKRMSADERRQYRRKSDLRNRLKGDNRDNQSSSTVAEQQKLLCYPNTAGKCDQLSVKCLKSHEMRPQRVLKFCNQSVVNNGIATCLKEGNQCIFMHQNEFPCKQYYLGSKKHDINSCPWMHSGPLTNEWRDILINYILTTQNKFGLIEENTIRQQFDEQHRKLVKSSSLQIVTHHPAILTNNDIPPAPQSTSNRTAINYDDVNDENDDVTFFDDISMQQSPPFYGFEL